MKEVHVFVGNTDRTDRFGSIRGFKAVIECKRRQGAAICKELSDFAADGNKEDYSYSGAFAVDDDVIHARVKSADVLVRDGLWIPANESILVRLFDPEEARKAEEAEKERKRFEWILLGIFAAIIVLGGLISGSI